MMEVVDVVAGRWEDRNGCRREREEKGSSEGHEPSPEKEAGPRLHKGWGVRYRGRVGGGGKGQGIRCDSVQALSPSRQAGRQVGSPAGGLEEEVEIRWWGRAEGAWRFKRS